MPTELVCPKHGPYDAAEGTCPYCRDEGGGRRPAMPPPLDEDDLPTDVEAGRARPRVHEEEEQTDLGRGHRQRGFLDEDEETELGKRSRGEDETEVDFVETGAQAILWVKEGNRRGKIYKVKDGTIVSRVSRKDADLIIDDPKISDPHAKFTCEGTQFVIWDFGSRNGTFVNGERIRAATPLKENDQVKMGNTVFVLKVLE